MVAFLRRRAPLIIAVVIALLLGYAAGVLVPSLRTPGDDSVEAGFARDMSTHHAQAVEMSMIAYPKASDVEVKTSAYNIALGQQAEIGVMQTWLKDWHLLPTGTRPKMAWMPDGERTLTNGLMPGMATDAELTQLQTATGRQLNILFCQLMLRHHLGGIHMIDGLLAESHDKQVTDVAEMMKKNQQAEIDVFRQTLTSLGAQPLGS
ncbi:MAG: hypothetical protein V7603_6575 [Micromonosporaceae bacterium]